MWSWHCVKRVYLSVVKHLERITFDPAVMGGRPCVRGFRVIVGLIASGHDEEEILRLYPYLEDEDINQALKFAAWRVQEIDLPTPR